MRQKLLLFLTIISVVFIISCSPKEPVKELKVMTWNIWHGGLYGSKADQFEKDTLNTLNVLKVIMGGDFNSGSHLDWGENTKKWHNNKSVEWPVSKLIADNGFTDSFREANSHPLQTMEGTWGFLNDGIISDRIDYIYYRGKKINTISSKIIMADPPGGFFNSGHRAILSVFYLK